MTALVFGGSGLTGKKLVQILLDSPRYEHVILFLRKEMNVKHKKLTQHLIDFDKLSNYSELIKGDVLFHCLGTTIKKAGSQAIFTKVDLDFPSKYASIAKDNGVRKLISISSVGTRPGAKSFYIRTKNLLEENFKKLNFETTHIVRPSLLIGKRDESRLAETFGSFVIKGLSFLMLGSLKRYRGVKVENLAKKLYELSLGEKTGYFVHESETI